MVRRPLCFQENKSLLRRVGELQKKADDSLLALEVRTLKSQLSDAEATIRQLRSSLHQAGTAAGASIERPKTAQVHPLHRSMHLPAAHWRGLHAPRKHSHRAYWTPRLTCAHNRLPPAVSFAQDALSACEEFDSELAELIKRNERSLVELRYDLAAAKREQGLSDDDGAGGSDDEEDEGAGVAAAAPGTPSRAGTFGRYDISGFTDSLRSTSSLSRGDRGGDGSSAYLHMRVREVSPDRVRPSTAAAMPRPGTSSGNRVLHSR